MRSKVLAAALASSAIFAGAAHAENYVSLSAGGSFLRNSDNQGAFAGPFVTGAGTTIPAGTTLLDGTSVGWTTEFNTGFALSGAVGRRFGPLRGEFEVAYQDNGVDLHRNVRVGGAPIGGEDAGVLITGSPNIGVSVADLVNDGEGGVDTVFLFANAFYDFSGFGKLKPYVGGGLGVGFADVTYRPSGVDIIDDRATVFAWQAAAGVSYELTPRTDLFAGYRYRATSDVEVNANLFPAQFDVQNRASIVEAGLRFAF